MKKLFQGLASLLVSAGLLAFASGSAPLFAANRAVMEGLPATNSAILVSTGTTAASSRVTVQNLSVSQLTPFQCVQTDAGGAITTSGGACGTGGGVISSTGTPLSIFNGSTLVSSPTLIVNFSSSDFKGSLLGLATSQVQLNTTVGQGQHFIITSPASQQTGFLNVSTTTALFGSWGSATATNGPSTTGYAIFAASGTAEAIDISINGTPSGLLQNQVGGVTIHGPTNISDGNNSPALLVLTDSTTNVTNGAGLMEIWENNPNHNSYLLWIHGMSSRNSDEPVRFDGPTYGIDEVSHSTDSAHGLGKWKVISIANTGVDLQIASSRAWDNNTFENLAYFHPLSKSDFPPGGYLHPQDLTDDSAVLTSSDTSVWGWNTLNNHTVGLTGPKNSSASYYFSIPSTVGSQGEVLFHNGNRGGNFSVRSIEWSDPGTVGQVFTMTAASTPTWQNPAGSPAGASYTYQYKNTGGTLSAGTLSLDAATNGAIIASTGAIELADTSNTHYVGFRSSNTLAGSTVWILPDQDGSSGDVLSTLGGGSGNHTLKWLTPTGTPGGSSNAIQYKSGSGFGGATDITFDGATNGLRMGTTAQIEFYESANDHFVGFKAQNSGMAGSTVWQLPNGDGTNNQVMATNGSTVLSFVSPGILSANQSWTGINTFTSSTTVAGLASNGHINSRGTPSPSSCGASGSIVGSDASGQITLGTGSPTGCTVTFNASWTNAPFCVVQTTSTVTTATVTAVSTSQFTVTTSATTPSNTIVYHCFGRD